MPKSKIIKKNKNVFDRLSKPKNNYGMDKESSQDEIGFKNKDTTQENFNSN